MPDAAPPLLNIRLFGPFEALLNGAPLPGLRRRQARWLLALLALRAGREVERAWLAGLLWPEPAETAALKNLRSSLADLRRALGPAAARLRSPTSHTLGLDVTSAEADVVAFDAALAAGDEASLERAVALHRGPLLEGCLEEWAFQERQVREQAYLGALETLAARALARGEIQAAERHLRRAVSADPLLESAQRALMRTLVDDGNYAAAVLAYRELRLRLHREINTEPDAETTALFQQLRAEARQKAGVRGEAGTREAGDGVSIVKGSVSDAVAVIPAVTDLQPLTPDPSGTVTFLFTDVEGSTRLWEEHPEAMREALAHHDALLRQAIKAHEGVVFKTVGDQFCAAFASAPKALAAALTAQRALLAEPWLGTGPVRVRMALHTGTAEAREGDYLGPPLNRVARLLEAGHGGQTLLSLATQELVRDHLPEESSLQDLGEHRLKDLTRPERVFQLQHPDLPANFPPLPTLDAHPHNLPAQPTPLIGRQREVETAQDLLRREGVRLLTLTGPGGTGKTRLGLQIAANLLADFIHGVYFVSLAPVSDPDLVTLAVAQVLAVREIGGPPLRASLKEFLREKQMLLLLDNFEQVLEAAPLVAELLASCPQLKLLVTSRAALHLRGEKEFPVPTLAVPDLRRLPPIEALSQYAAVELFIRRALDVQPEFAVTNENAPAVAEICVRLDGLPLAIELAAARMKLFSPQALLSRLERRLPLLTGGARDLPARQQTLRAAIAWSYDLLDDGEKRLFRRLCVFVGGCTLEATEAVGGAVGCQPSAVSEDVLAPTDSRQPDTHGVGDADSLPLGVLEGVASLVDKSLLRQEAEVGGEPRFGMLETIREFGLERLVENGEEAETRQQHAQFFVGLAEAAWPGEGETGFLWDPREKERLDRFEREHDNLRAALAWSQAAPGRAETRLRLAASLWCSCAWGRWSEVRSWWESLLAPDGPLGPRAARARAAALRGAATVAGSLGGAAAQRARWEECLALSRELDFREGIAWALQALGHMALPSGRDRADPEAARALYQESQAIFREIGHKAGVAELLSDLARLSLRQGDYSAARARLEESLEFWRKTGRKNHIAGALSELANVAQAQEDHQKARALREEALALNSAVGDNMCRGDLLLELGDYAAARSRYEECLAPLRAAASPAQLAWSLVHAGHAAWLLGESAVTQSHSLEALGLFRERDDPEGVLAALESLAVAALAQGEKERAARLLGAAEARREALELPATGVSWWRRPRERIGEAVRAESLEQEFATAWAEGRAMSLEEAIRVALAADEIPTPA